MKIYKKTIKIFLSYNLLDYSYLKIHGQIWKFGYKYESDKIIWFIYKIIY